ncbi:MAG: hypothetical protein JW894_07370 [Bacteroidales bacterium]|nr:hypothetical protein [Bacteroidales bacterium]
MYFEVDKTYHLYNRSNETVFYNRDNYLYFLAKVNKLIKPYTYILSWCLMPNHFHFLFVANSNGCKYIQEKHRPYVQILSKNIGTLLSSYTRAINKEHKRKGKLFAHNTIAKCLNDNIKNDDFLENCFHCIHQNPLRAGLCNTLETWEFSSFRDYAGYRSGKLINKDLASEMINFDSEDFVTQSYAVVDERIVKGMF